jgi:lipoprotein-releasing system ATP-binding protein
LEISANNIVLSATGIYKTFGDVAVLKDVDLSVTRGELISIVGASGAGKTTLLQIIGTLDRADRGQVFINNQPISALNSKKLAAFRNKHIGFIFQFHHLLPEFTAIENVCIPAFIAQKSVKEAEARATELLQFLGLGHRLHHKPSMLSGGEQQRVAVARALMNKPDIIFADEPSGNLDSANATELHNLFFKLRTEMGQTFIIVTHNNQLAAMADRTLTMKDGNIVNITEKTQ